jgi:hypothetical protein
MMNVICVTLLGESFVLPETDESAVYGFYRNEYVLTSSPERAISIAKTRTLKKLAKRSIETLGSTSAHLRVERITEQMPLSRLLRNEGFQFFRTDPEGTQEDDAEANFSSKDNAQRKIRVYIDLSVMTVEPSAGGCVSGVIDLIPVPGVGDTVVLARSISATPYPPVVGFTGHFKVSDVLFQPASHPVSIALNFEDLTVPTIADARIIMKFLEEGFALSADEFE